MRNPQPRRRSLAVRLVVGVAVTVALIILFMIWLIIAISSIVLRGIFRVFPV